MDVAALIIAAVGESLGAPAGRILTALANLRKMRGPKKLLLVARTSSESLKIKFSGHAQITYWWKPPDPLMDCKVKPGKLQFSTKSDEMFHNAQSSKSATDHHGDYARALKKKTEGKKAHAGRI